MQMIFHRKLPIPKDVKAEYPLTEKMEQVKAETIKSLCLNIFQGSEG